MLLRILLLLLTVQGCMAQHALRIIVTSPAKDNATDIYMAGSFNGWNPKDETFRLRKDDKGNFTLALQNIPAGDYEYKFTRGSWETGEINEKGQPAANRNLRLVSDTTLRLTVAGWAQGLNAASRNTASANVHVIDTAFYIPQLKRYRKIWIYLPAGYATSKKKYPVLYMHDGQNLFNEATAYAGEWGVDEALDTAKKQCIVVGIDNGLLKRMNEYNPYDNDRFGKGEGQQYVDFIAKTLKPFIDKKYRTLAAKQHTMIAGSSMGGLISMYAIVRHPNVFGGAGVFSPSFWIAPKLNAYIKQNVKASTHRNSRIYFYAGERESKDLVREVLAVFETMRMKAGCQMQVKINAEGEHNEASWRGEFPVFYNWMVR